MKKLCNSINIVLILILIKVFFLERRRRIFEESKFIYDKIIHHAELIEKKYIPWFELYYLSLVNALYNKIRKWYMQCST